MLGKLRNLFGGSRESRFWTWFAANEAQIYTFEANQEAMFDQIEVQLKQVNPYLCFAFGAVQDDGRREFVISADGVRSAFPAVESLYAAAPPLPRWELVKFRPRIGTLFDVELDGKMVRSGSVRYLLTPSGRKADIVVYFETYDQAMKDAFAQIGFLYLDNMLGEYAVATQLGSIEFTGQSTNGFAQSRPISELAAQFDRLMSQR